MRRAAPLALAALVAVVAVIVLSGGGGDKYTVNLRLANAQGLRDGSPVVIGGVPIGTVKLDATQRDVEVKLEIEDKYAPIGRNATAAVIAQNVLGQKQVRITPGQKSDPAPDGYTLPKARIVETTDLDQLLAALDPDTRTRLGILLHETGTAFAGRKLDFKHFIEDLAPALSNGADVLGQLTRDNRALTKLVESSDHLVAAITPERRKISRMLDVLGQTTETVAARRSHLRETLRRAPGGLASARGFLAELRQTMSPLATTGRQLAATAPALELALDRIPPFQRAAAPALRTLRRTAAPKIKELASSRSNAELTQIVSTVGKLKLLGQNELPPVGAALDKSMDNLLALVDNWSRAVQFRDRLGHVFRGEASVAPDLLDSVLGRLAKRFAKKAKPRTPAKRVQDRRPSQSPAPKADAKPVRKPSLTEPVKRIGDKVKKVIDDLLKPRKPQDAPAPSNDGNALRPLLDFLLGPNP